MLNDVGKHGESKRQRLEVCLVAVGVCGTVFAVLLDMQQDSLQMSCCSSASCTARQSSGVLLRSAQYIAFPTRFRALLGSGHLCART